MTDLIVRLHANGDCAWRDDTGAVAGHGPLADAAAAARGRRVRLLVPGVDVLLMHANVPAQQRARALAAIPWALEDLLAEDVEALHFALGARAGDGQWPVAIVARRTLGDWLDQCAAAGLQPVSICPESLALPVPAADEWTALEEDGCVTVRTAVDGGFACEPALLDSMAAVLTPPARIRRLGATDVAWPAVFADCLDEPEPLASADDPALAVLGSGDDGIDLLQGEFSRRERAGRRLRRWRVPAAIALAVLVLGAVQFALAYSALTDREARLRADQKAMFQQLFPDVQQVRDPRAQLAARLQSLQQSGERSGGFADLLAQAGDVIADAEVEITSLIWRPPALELRIDAATLQTVDKVKRGLIDAGMQARVKSASRGEGRIDGRIVVKAGGR